VSDGRPGEPAPEDKKEIPSSIPGHEPDRPESGPERPLLDGYVLNQTEIDELLLQHGSDY